MDMLDLMAKRRSVPPQMMQGPAPSEAEITQLLTIASRVPDHGKLGRWRFIVFEGEARNRAGEAIAAAFAADKPDASADTIAYERGRLARAPLVIGVVGRTGAHTKIPEWEQHLTLGAVCMSLSLAAQAMGYATCWLTEWFSYDRRVLAKLGLEPQERMAGFVHIGRSDTRPTERERPDVAAITSRF
ncbi:MAG: nitroreductase family protein [Bosea sp. (in: a-proteobacteria)]